MSVKAMAYVWETPYKGAQKLMLLAIADRCDDEGTCYPGVAKLAEKCGIKTRAAQALITELERNDEIVAQIGTGIETGHGKTNRYFMKQYRASIGLKTPMHGTRIQQITPPENGVQYPASLDYGVQKSASQAMQDPASQGMQKSAFNTSGDTSVDTSEETTLPIAIATGAGAASPSHTSSLADEADDPAMFQKPTARQLSSRVENGRKRLTATTPMSSATAPSPSLKPKSPTAQNTTAPIPHSAPPLSPADAPVSVDDVERFSSKLEQDKGKKAAKRSEAQLANDALVEALRVAWFTAREKEPVALGRTDYSNYLKVARVLVEGGATTDLFFTYVQYWFKASVAGGWTLTINSLVNNGRIADFKSWYASRAKKAISRDSTSTQVSTTQTGSKRAYDRRSDPTYAHLYETPTEVKQAK
jgi:hypothetical protein